MRARIVQESAPGEHRFLHALVRRAVVDDMPAPERRALARDVARTLARLDGDRSVAEVAYHLLDAVPLVAADEAVDVARRAAAAARRAVAYDDAARLLEAVLPLVPAGRRRGVLLLEVADARMRAGDVASAQARCLQATELGRSIDDGTLVVDAALAFEDANWRAALHGGVPRSCCGPRCRWLPTRGQRPRAAALSRALALSGKGDEAEALVAETVPEARALGVYQAVRMAYAAALFVPWTPDNLDRLRRTARELIDLARAEGDLEWELGAIDKLLFGTITAGYLDEARRLRARHGELTGRIGQPLFRVLDLQAQALMAMGEGRFVEAEAHAEEADALAGFLSGNDVAGGYGVQLFSIRRDQGRLDEARPLVEAVARLDRVGATWRPALTVLQAELGLHDEARAGLGVLVADGLAAVPRTRCGGRRSPTSPTPPSCSATGTRRWPSTASWCRRGASSSRRRTCWPPTARPTARSASCACCSAGTATPRAHFEAALRLERRARMPVWLAPPSSPTAGSSASGAVRATASGRPPCCGPPGRPGWRSGWPGSRPRPRRWSTGSAPPERTPPRRGGAAGGGSGGRRPHRPRAGAAAAPGRGPHQPGDRRAAPHQPAHGGQPRAVDPAQDRLRQPHRGRGPGRCGRVSPATDGGRPRLSGRRGWRRATARSPR